MVMITAACLPSLRLVKATVEESGEVVGIYLLHFSSRGPRISEPVVIIPVGVSLATLLFYKWRMNLKFTSRLTFLTAGYDDRLFWQITAFSQLAVSDFVS